MFKKTIFKRILLSILALFMLTVSFVSCGDGATVLSSNGISVNKRMYRYWYKELKNYYLESYVDMVDSPEYWNTESPELGKTYGEHFDERIRTQINYYMAGAILFEEYDLSYVKKNDWNLIKAAIDLEIEDGVNASGTRSQYDEYLQKTKGVTLDDYRNIRFIEEKFTYLYQYLYNTKTGVEKATDAEIKAFYHENYTRVKYYTVLKNYDFKLDANGNRVLDSTGSYVKEPLTEAEKAEKALYAREVFEKISAGTDIDVYIKKDFPEIISYAPRGYYLLQNETYAQLFTPTIVNAAFDMAVGETVLCENEDAFFVVQRFDLVENAYTGADKDQFSSLGTYAINEKFENRFKEVIDSVEVDFDAVKEFSVTNIK